MTKLLSKLNTTIKSMTNIQITVVTGIIIWLELMMGFFVLQPFSFTLKNIVIITASAFIASVNFYLFVELNQPTKAGVT
jgi:hypothetical protein